MPGLRLAPVLLVSMLLATTPLQAAPPLWKQLIPTDRVSADPNGTYQLEQTRGPWLIMTATFSGEGAEEQARLLAIELRERYNLSAYTHSMEFDFSDDLEVLSARGQKKTYRRGKQFEEFAVLVGDFPSVDDPVAQQTLRQIKKLEPKTLTGEYNDRTTQNLAGWRALKNMVLAKKDASRKRGPMGHAFVTRNPMLPQEYFVPQGVDSLVARMNEGVEHSLLDCPGKRTIRVATFTAPMKIAGAGQQFLGPSGASKPKKRDSRHPLEIAAESAHKMTVALRALGWEAYEFHDRHESVVTIGSFDEVARQTQDGRQVPLRDVQIIFRTFDAAFPLPKKAEVQPAAYQAETAKAEIISAYKDQLGVQPTGLEPKQLAGVPFDIHPRVMDVPKRTVASVLWK